MGLGVEGMKVVVQGLWHLGCVTAACLASKGHDVLGFDADEEVVSRLSSGNGPIFEPGLDELIWVGLESGRLRFTADANDIPVDTQVLWVAYDTPVDSDDVADIAFVIAQVELVLPSIPRGTTVIVSSQLPVGSTARLEDLAEKRVPEGNLSFACAPENLRLGKALEVFLNPDRIVVGVRSEKDKERVRMLLAPITDRIEWMSVESAEMTKHAINAFLATSVVFANEIATICEVVGADAKEVERGLKSEQRIGPKAYLGPGAAFAGGTLARDIEFLKQAGHRGRVELPLLNSVKASNDSHKRWVHRKLESLFPTLDGVRVALLGLTYKPGTDTLRRSLAVELCEWLISRGADVHVHDPMVKELPVGWRARVTRFDDPSKAIEGVQAMIIGTEWPQYRDISSDMLGKIAPELSVLDANRFLSSLQTASSIRYFAVGSPDR